MTDRTSGIARRLLIFPMAMLAIAASGCAALQQDVVVPPAAPVATIWQKLGVPAGMKAFQTARDNLINRRGNFPGLERKPPVKRLADPANLESEVPAVKAAAGIKQKEDLAPQKIKALKYLAEAACGCYDEDGIVEAAFLDALKDCTEDVRKAAIEGIETTLSRCKCGSCCGTCCTARIQKRLADMATGQKPDGCWIEPSVELRRMAGQLLCACPVAPMEFEEFDGPAVGELPEPFERIGTPAPLAKPEDTPPPVEPAGNSGKEETSPPDNEFSPEELSPKGGTEQSPGLEEARLPLMDFGLRKSKPRNVATRELTPRATAKPQQPRVLRVTDVSRSAQANWKPTRPSGTSVVSKANRSNRSVLSNRLPARQASPAQRAVAWLSDRPDAARGKIRQVAGFVPVPKTKAAARTSSQRVAPTSGPWLGTIEVIDQRARTALVSVKSHANVTAGSTVWARFSKDGKTQTLPVEVVHAKPGLLVLNATAFTGTPMGTTVHISLPRTN